MKILLLGEYSNVHWTLAEGLRALGNEVVVISDGDGWKDYRRDIDLTRRSLGKYHTLKYYAHILQLLPQMRGYDIVQIINPIFFNLRATRMKPFYRYLRHHNRHIVMGAFGMDHYWVKTCMDCTTFRYSDFNIGSTLRSDEPCNRQFVKDWLNGEKTQLNIDIAQDCDAIVAGLYEYYQCYQPTYPDKTTYIPFPIKEATDHTVDTQPHEPISFFIGIQRSRNQYKGTDIMLRALERVKAKYPTRCNIVKAENVPFEQYRQMIDTSDILLDQLYSYTPAMNALLAMSQGMVVVGGGEPENYEILGETQLRPIINVQPNEESCFRQMEWLVQHSEEIPRLKQESMEYIHRHHNHIKVARQYMDLYKSL